MPGEQEGERGGWGRAVEELGYPSARGAVQMASQQLEFHFRLLRAEEPPVCRAFFLSQSRQSNLGFVFCT